MTLVEMLRAGGPAKRPLFPDQVEAVDRLVRHLRRAGSRGLLVAATGTGKMLISVRVADGLGARLVLFVVPTLDLAAQTALAWRRDGHGEHMDNERAYGPKIHEYPLAKAVAAGRAADYRIVIPTLTDADLRTRLNLPAPGATARGDGENQGQTEGALRTTALHLAVLKAMTEHSLRRVLVYFTLVSDARRFARELPHTLRLLRKTAPQLAPDIDPRLLFVHGEYTPAERQDLFDDFAAAPRAIMSNARLISEGVDIPSVDAIVFADPTRSVIRCVQALGRALRTDVSGKVASLIVPVYVPPRADLEDILGTAYEPVWAIATALASHDHRILERLPDKANRLPRETSELIQHRWHFDFTVHPERIARAMDLIAFDPRDTVVSRSRREGLAAAQAYRDQFGHLDVPTGHVDPTGYTLGTFITTMRDAHTAGRLAADWIAELDALGMIWDKHQAAWRARLTAAADYQQANGHLAAPGTTPVGAWLAEQRHLAAKNQLDATRAAGLAALDADWKLPHGADWHRKYHLLRDHLAAGHDPNALTRDTQLANVTIGSWLHRQLTTWHTLSPRQQDLLTRLGLAPGTNPLAPARRARRTFEQTVQLLELFLHRERRPPPPGRRSPLTARPSGSALGSPRRAPSTAPVSSVGITNGVAALFDGDWLDEDAVPAFA